MNNHYCVWANHKQTHQWIAYKTERDIYNMLLYTIRSKQCQKKILEKQKEHQATVQIVNRMTNRNQQNPLPDRNPVEFTEELMNYFLHKIKIVRKLFNKHRTIYT